MKKTLILEGIVGSHAQGLATKDSDVDKLGIFAFPTAAFSGIYPPDNKASTVVTMNPDRTIHEVGKFFRLALKGNPSVFELLYLPYYTECEETGAHIVLNRRSFLHEGILSHYFGMASHRAAEYAKTGKEKAARNAVRVLEQAESLCRTGTFEVRVSDPEFYFALGEKPPLEVQSMVEDKITFIKSLNNELPSHPDLVRLESILRHVRRSYE